MYLVNFIKWTLKKHECWPCFRCTHKLLCKVGLGMQKHAQTTLRFRLLDGRGQRATNCVKRGGQRRCGLLPKNRNITRRSVKKDNWTVTYLLMALTSDNELTPRLNLGHGKKMQRRRCWSTRCMLKELWLMFTCLISCSVSYPLTNIKIIHTTDSGQVTVGFRL